MTQALWGVIVKETVDAMRDRRSLLSAFAYTLVGPLAMGLALSVTARDIGDGPFTVGVSGAAHAPSLVAALAESAAVEPIGDDDAEPLVGNGTLAIAVVVPADYTRHLETHRPAAVRVVHDRGSAASRAALPRVQAVLAAYARQMADARLVARGIAPRVAHPVEAQPLDLSTPLSRAAPALATLPVFLVLAAFVTGMNLAIDATAGERERRSLEALLVSPAPPTAIVAGKWLVAAGLGAAGIVVTLAAARAVLTSERIRALDLPLDLPWPTAAAMLLVLLPLALAVPAIQMLIAIFCRSYKEGQTYLSLLLFMPMMSGFLFAFDAVTVSPWMAWTPLVAHQLAVAALLQGEPVALAPAIGAGLAALSAGLAALALCVRVLGDERRVLI
jgi:sodium transport system permease protein